MHALWLVSVWLHLLAATTWLGGMIFLVLVVVPWLRRGDRARAAALLRETGTRFRAVGWICFAVLAVTGGYNAWMRGVRWGSFVDRDWLASPLGHALVLKLTLFAVVLALSAWHDFGVGPRAAIAGERDPGAPDSERLRRLASRMGRVNFVLGLTLFALAVILVRGWP